MASVGERAFVAGGMVAAETSTDDVLFREKDLEKWTPDKIEEKLIETRSIVKRLFRQIEKEIARTGEPPEYQSLLEHEVRRLKRISELAQGYLESQKNSKSGCLTIGLQEVVGLTNRVAEAAFWAGAMADYAMFAIQQSPTPLIGAATSCASIQAGAGNVATYLGGRLATMEGVIGDAIRIDGEARELLEQITLALENWRIKIERHAVATGDAFQIEDQVRDLTEEFGRIPDLGLLIGLLDSYDKSVLKTLEFSVSPVGRALSEARDQILRERAAKTIQKVHKRRVSTRAIGGKTAGEIVVVVDGGGVGALEREESRRLTTEEILEELSRDQPKRPSPNIGVTIGDWAKAVSQARRAGEMYVKFIAQQSESGSAGAVDFRKVLFFLREQLHVIDRAVELANAEERTVSTVCGYDTNTLLSWLTWGITNAASAASIWADSSLAKAKEGDPFDSTKVKIGMSAKIIAGASQYAGDRITLVRKRREKINTRVENLLAEAKTARRFIATYLTRYRGFVEDIDERGVVPREAFEEDVDTTRRSPRGIRRAGFEGGASGAAAGKSGITSTFRMVEAMGMRGVVERMIHRMSSYREGEDGMSKQEFASMLIQQYKERYPDLGMDAFRPSCPDEIELFRAFTKHMSAIRGASGVRGGASFYRSPLRSSPVARDYSGIGIGIPEVASGSSRESASPDAAIGASVPVEIAADAEEIAGRSRRGLIDLMTAQLKSFPDSERNEAGMELMRKYLERFPFIAMEHFSNPGDREQCLLLEAFFRIKSQVREIEEEA